jgi:predicted acyltransferase
MTSPALSTLPAPEAAHARPRRWLSVDVLRGLTIAFMIMVNNNGSGAHAFWAMKHARWNGFTPTDLVFPTFLFLVGLSTVFSTEARYAAGERRQTIFLHSVRRAIILFLLGLLVNTFPGFQLDHLRVYGVLQRIAVCYLIVAALYLLRLSWKHLLLISVAALLGYWALMRFVPVPGFGVPTHQIPLLDRDNNLTSWLDRQIFSPQHLYEQTRDPEGLLSDLPALATALFGALTAIWLRTGRSVVQKARSIALAGLTGLVLGALWNFEFAINKKLWTSSFVLYAAGWSLLLLALSIWFVDILQADSPDSVKRGRCMPLLVFGTNAIAAYVFSELLPGALNLIHPSPAVPLTRFAYRAILLRIPQPQIASLVYSVAFVTLCWFATYILYRRKIFIRI